MADGLRCQHCGWQETDHELWEEQEHPDRELPGYDVPLADCKNFSLSQEGQRLARIYEEKRLEEERCFAERERVYTEVMETFAPDFLEWARLGFVLRKR